MGKFALLIGVGSYRSSDLQDLLAAPRDVEAMQRVLVDPAIGGFAVEDVQVLENPGVQNIREAIERLFADRQRDDLLLLYFSGHGVVDEAGRFHLTAADTDQRLLSSTAISAIFVHELMEKQGKDRSQRQVVILDSCFSGAFAKGMAAKGDGVNLLPQLGGKGRAVMTSSKGTEYSFEQKGAELSIYTQYVVEGLRTGIADRDEDGWISVKELHEFAKTKVQEMAPAMQPEKLRSLQRLGMGGFHRSYDVDLFDNSKGNFRSTRSIQFCMRFCSPIGSSRRIYKSFQKLLKSF
jgi:uncharacterized caspase-like protein